jgi:hypothetical protein
MATLFDAPSPSGRNDAKLFLNSRGQLLDRYGRHWGGSQIRKMAHDALPPDLGHGAAGAGETNEHERKASEMRAAMQKLMDGFDLHDEVAGAISALLDKYFPAENRRAPGPDAVRGAGARDRGGPLSRHRAPGGGDEDDESDGPDLERFARFLAQKGLDRTEIAEALKIVGAGEAEDEIPENAVHGGPPIKGRVGPELDLAKEYPGSELVTRDVYGDQPEPSRHLIGGGIVARVGSRSMPAGDAALASDEDIEEQITREYGPGPKVGMFG